MMAIDHITEFRCTTLGLSRILAGAELPAFASGIERMNRHDSVCVLMLTLALAATSVLASANEGPQWPAGALDKGSPTVVGFYAAMCERYADGNGLSGAERDSFRENCMMSIARVFPVGYEEGSGGGGE
ncbi:MAG: hypothetical protein K9M02_05660 [Thiohalocapsa sp.]|nr:hypothetical protein [Thiohalocapsa sp.]